MREIGVLEARTNFSALLAEIERSGEEIILTRYGKEVARLTPPKREQVRSEAEKQRIRDAVKRLEEIRKSAGPGDFDWKAAVEEGRM